MEDVKKENRQIYVGRMIHILSNQMKRESVMPRDTHGLTTMQKHVLKYILLETLESDLYQKDIEEEFQIRKSTASGILQLMEKNGFIIRQCVKEDARRKRIIPTKKAEALRAEILENIQDMEKCLRAGISKKEFDICMKVLCQMQRNLSDNRKNYAEKEENT